MLYQEYRNSHDKDKPYLNNVNTYTWKDALCIETSAYLQEFQT